MRTLLRLFPAALLVAALAVAAPTAGAQEALSSPTMSALAFSREPSPVLIRKAMRAGGIDRATGLVYLARALFAPNLLPAEYRSDTPFHGTIYLLEVQRGLGELSATQRAEVEALLAPRASGPTLLDVGPGTQVCDLAPLPTVDVLETAHFYIEYNDAELNANLDGLTIADYAESLEHTWTTEIDSFEWPAPPKGGLLQAPGGKYVVKVQNLGPVLYGFVSNTGTSAGAVGDNPNTAWNDEDADASCMGLNSDYSMFPGSPRRALDATAAHEFNHSIQFGMGGLSGDNVPDDIYIEGGATWMEDEAYDSANDNYNYLWPVFENDMGEYEDSPYPYWITFRGLTERFGASEPGRGEEVFQRFWELTSKNQASNLEALDRALRETKGISLPQAYHDYAIAVKFNETCGSKFPRPYCFEEGRQYVNGDGVQTGAGETQVHASIASVGASHSGSVLDNYALNWVALPVSPNIYRVTLENTSAGGTIRASLGCRQATTLAVQHVTASLAAGQAATVQNKWRQKCQSLVAVITNVTQTAANPSESAERSYTLSTS